ncbi:MAG TPA: serine/threonine-protein kinase [Gemmata sp.]|nr:serine/threonine-protein kinase [Gemmata sp.]
MPGSHVGADDPPTVRVSVINPSHAIASSVKTPPPSGERKISQSVFSSAIRNESGTIGTPLQVGDKILGFELVEELGQGAFARVFLARQESLARRLVALKVTLRPTREAERLARLQHTHIVPVYSVHEAAPVQVICMPYLGRRTIADLIRVFRADHGSRGLVYRKTSGTRPARTTTTPDCPSTPKTTPPSGTFARPLDLAAGETLPSLIGEPTAILQILGQLATGLSHAHERGILHLDLKPANVLLADTGEPMLLDFNLSFDVTNPDRELIGGTVPYMSTEQLQDLRTRGKGKVDARTDLYSLGVMAFEMLTGAVPFPASFLADIDGLIAARQKGPPSIRKLNPAVSPAIESIIRKLLAPDPQDRYQTANELQTDVERHLNNLPLRFAREASIWERLGKWRRRNPRVPGRLVAASFLALAIGLGGVAHTRAEANAKAQAVSQVNVTRSALDTVRLDLILPGDPVSRTRGIAKATDMLAVYGLPDDSNWEKSETVRHLSEQERTALRGDLGELLLLLAQARWQEAEDRPDSERREVAVAVLKLTTAASTCFSSGSVPQLLDQLVSKMTRVMGEADEPATPRDANSKADARELFLDAAAYVYSGQYQTAIKSLEKTIEEQPGHAAAQFCLAYCRQQLGDYQRAIERYDAARVLMPTDPRPFFQRGLVYGILEKPAEAEKEFSRAIELNPEYAQAYRNRGVARLRIGKLQEAEEDLTTALTHGAPAIQIHLLRVEARKKRGDTQGAKADQETAANLTPKLEGDYLIRGLSRMDEDPRGAIEDFQEAAKINPRSLSAIQNQIHVLADKLNDLPGALALATQAIQLYPEYAPARAGRAVILARLGRREEAHQEIAKARILSADPGIIYRAACVYSLTSSKHPADRDEALKYLWKALSERYRDHGGLARDKDLDPIRTHAEFRKIEETAASLK